MGNTFTAGNDGHVSLSNGATRVFFDVLALVGSSVAVTRWQQEFVLHVLDRALDRHGWERLHYAPVGVRDHLLAFRPMLARFTPRPTSGSPRGDWTVSPPVHGVDRCARHHVFRGEYGCRLCDVSCQPLAAPRVWELVSVRRAGDGAVAHREVVQVPDALSAYLGSGRPAADGTGARRPVEPGDRIASALGRVLDPGLEHHLQVAVA